MLSDTQLKQEKIKSLKDSFHALMWISMRQFSQQLQKYNLTQPQFITLASLAAHQQACTMRELTDVTFQDPPTMTGIVDRLVKTDLVKRTRSETDRRVVLVQITLTGQQLIQQIDNDFMQSGNSCYASLSDEELEIFEKFIWLQLRVLVGRYRDIQATDLDTEIEGLQKFMSDPIHYLRLENSGKD
jgi:DNA-binding MarR family transcriptional regulator